MPQCRERIYCTGSLMIIELVLCDLTNSVVETRREWSNNVFCRVLSVVRKITRSNIQLRFCNCPRATGINGSFEGRRSPTTQSRGVLARSSGPKVRADELREGKKAWRAERSAKWHVFCSAELAGSGCRLYCWIRGPCSGGGDCCCGLRVPSGEVARDAGRGVRRCPPRACRRCLGSATTLPAVARPHGGGHSCVAR